jgi:hypothetical protein
MVQQPFEQIDSAEVWQRLRGRLNVRAGSPSVSYLAGSVQPTVAIEPLLGKTRGGYWTQTVNADAIFVFATVPNGELWHLGPWRYAPVGGSFSSQFRLAIPDYSDPTLTVYIPLMEGGASGTDVLGDATGILLRPGNQLVLGTTTYSSQGTAYLYIFMQVEDISS